jgi:hypothetical protein
MKISPKLLRVWNEKRTRGDIPRLMAFTQVSKPTIIRAIKHGQGNEEIVLKISQFFSEKETEKDIESKALNLLINGTTAKNI